MKLVTACIATVSALLVMSLGFAVHLTPPPTEVARKWVSESQQPAAGVQAPSTQTMAEPSEEAVAGMLRRGWLMNAALLVIGVASSATWLIFRTRRTASWISLLGIGLFIAVFAIWVLPSRLYGFEEWMTMMHRVSAVGGWAFVGAEIHRLVALLVAIAAFVVVALHLRSFRGPADT